MNRLFVFLLLLSFVFGLSLFADDAEELPSSEADYAEFVYDDENDEDAYIYDEFLSNGEYEYIYIYDDFVGGNEPADTVASSTSVDASALADAPIPGHITNNQYFLESVRYTNMAQAAYEEGDYDASIRYSEEAIRYAQLSDEYVAMRLKIKETDDAIAAAKERLDWASSQAVNAVERFPDEYNKAQISYETAVNFRRGEFWDNSITFAHDVINTLAYVTETGGSGTLPAQYTVRTWTEAGDCLWNIAGRPWVYGDPNQWRRLYDANRSKFPSPDNPDLIEPGMVLDIPSIGSEVRQGMWSASGTYMPLLSR